MNKPPLNVLIVDDSANVRQTLREIIESDPALKVIGTAADPYIAAKKMKDNPPDVMTLDVEMPRMDGLTFLRKIMAQRPMPVVVCSSLTGENSPLALRAIDYGAVEVINKPRVEVRKFLQEARIQITDVIKAAAQAEMKNAKKTFPGEKLVIQPKLSADVILSQVGKNDKTDFSTTDKVVAIGASTGGTEALRVLLESMPPDAPGLIIVQHMPEHFTAAFANRLNSTCAITVKEAADNDSILRGQALIAPGNHHLLLQRSGAKYHAQIKEGPLVSRHRPSVDVLFRSVARHAGQNAIGVIMTGMGDDGANGLQEMHEAGAHTIAQNEATCIIYGMPQAAIKLGCVNKTLPLSSISGEIIRHFRREKVKN